MSDYIGRFAPSPTGPLHMGSLYTAVASYLDARANQGRWLLRIEDLDPPREQAGADQLIISSLHAHGLHWDGNIVYQSQRSKLYDQAIRQLQSQGHCFYCNCSRKQLQAFHGEYSGKCRDRQLPGNTGQGCAIRLKTDTHLDTGFTDRLQGHQQPADLPTGCYRDFVIFRKDGLYAYQLAVVVDDIAQGVTDIVRGIDILDSTFKQAWLYHYLQHTKPTYLHLPVITNLQGQKLSKQNHAPAVDNHRPLDNLLQVLRWLGQPPPPAACQQNPQAILQWAAAHWDIKALVPGSGIACQPA